MQTGFRRKLNDRALRVKDGAERKSAGKLSRKRQVAAKNRHMAWKIAGRVK